MGENEYCKSVLWCIVSDCTHKFKNSKNLQIDFVIYHEFERPREIPTMPKRWTSIDEAYLAANYEKIPINDLAKEFGVTKKAVRVKYGKLRKRNDFCDLATQAPQTLPVSFIRQLASGPHMWSYDEEFFLISNYKFMSLEELAGRFGATKKAVRVKYGKLRKRKYYEKILEKASDPQSYFLIDILNNLKIICAFVGETKGNNLLRILRRKVNDLVSLACSEKILSTDSYFGDDILKINSNSKCLKDISYLLENKRYSLSELESIVQDINSLYRKFNILFLSILNENTRYLANIAFSKDIISTDLRYGDDIVAINIKSKSLMDIQYNIDNEIYSINKLESKIKATESLKCKIKGILKLTLEEELLNVALSAAPSKNLNRNALMFMSYHGWDGKGGLTLEEIGKNYGITRERVRQIRSRMDIRFQAHNITAFTPILDKALTLIRKNMPCFSDDIEVKLVAEGITKLRFNLSGLLNAAITLRKGNFKIEVVKQSKEQIIVPNSMASFKRSILVIAKKSVRRWGVTSIEDIIGHINVDKSISLNDNFLVRLFDNLQEIKWLEKKGGWFWFKSILHNRLTSRIEKVLSVAKRIHVSELRICIRRDFEMKGFAPPRLILLELCRQLPEYTVEDDYIIVEKTLRWEDVLNVGEMTMVLALKEEGPALERDEFVKYCIDLGMNCNTINRYLSHSPVILRLAYMVYGLPGAKIDAATVQSLIPTRKLKRVLKDYGWTNDGKIWLGYKISSSMMRDGLFTVPSSMKRYLIGSFALKTIDGANISSIIIKQEGAWGLGSFIRRRGGETGDMLVLRFNLTKRNVSKRVGHNLFRNWFRSPLFLEG